MMIKRCFLFWVLKFSVILVVYNPVSAADIGASVKLGTAGFGGDVTTGLTERFNARFGINMFLLRIYFEDERDLENITAEIKLQTLPLLLDWHPFVSNFRLSAGMVLNFNRVTVSADPKAVIEINEVEYRIEKLSGEMKFNQLSPYFGIGYGNAARGKGRLAFSFDFGLMYHGVPDVDARAAAANPALQFALERDLDVEIEEFRDDVSAFRFYPVLSFGISYRF